MSYIIYKKAKDDLYYILKNISNISNSYYLTFLNKLLQKLSSLSDFPEMYPLLSKNYSYRKIIIDNYIVIYKLENNSIIILRVFSRFEDYIGKL